MSSKDQLLLEQAYKSTFKKQPNAPEQQYKVNLQVTIPQQQAQPKA